MKIEKINENRIQITFNSYDLQKNNLDIHSFMSNSIETQSLFLSMLDQAEHEVGFVTDNYKLSIEALALSNGTFIITVTRIEKEILKSTRVQAHRKTNISSNNTLIYSFLNFDDFCTFRNFLSISQPDLIENLSKTNLLYQYNECFFLIIQNIDEKFINRICGNLSEFATPIEYSDLIIHKIKEYGKLITLDAIHTK